MFRHAPLNSSTSSSQPKTPFGMITLPNVGQRSVQLSGDGRLQSHPDFKFAQANYGVCTFNIRPGTVSSNNETQQRTNEVDPQLNILLLQDHDRVQPNDYKITGSAIYKMNASNTQWVPVSASAPSAFPCTNAAQSNPWRTNMMISSYTPEALIWVSVSPNGNIAAGYGNFAAGQNVFAQVWDRQFDDSRTKIRFFGFRNSRSTAYTTPLTVYNIQSFASMDAYSFGDEV